MMSQSCSIQCLQGFTDKVGLVGRVLINDLDRYHLLADVIGRVPRLSYVAAYAKRLVRDKLRQQPLLPRGLVAGAGGSAASPDVGELAVAIGAADLGAGGAAIVKQRP